MAANFGAEFFNSVRASLFNKSLSQPQVDGMNAILAAWQRSGDGAGSNCLVAGLLVMTNPLTQIRVSTADAFDQGSINVRYS